MTNRKVTLSAALAAWLSAAGCNEAPRLVAPPDTAVDTRYEVLVGLEV